MRRLDRHIDGAARLQRERFTTLGEGVTPRQVAMAAIVKALMRLAVDERLVAGGKNGHCLAATDLEQDVVLGIEMERRHRVRRRDEDERLLLQHRAGIGEHSRLELGQRLAQQVAVERVLLDELEHHPRTAMLDRPDRFLDRKAVGGRVARIETDRNVAAIIFGVDRTDPARKLGERLQLQQRVVDEVVADQGRLLGIGGGEGGTRRLVESDAGHGFPLAERRRSAPRPVSSARQTAKTNERRNPLRRTVTRTMSRRPDQRLSIIG